MMKTTKKQNLTRHSSNQQGQTFVGYFIVIVALMSLTVTVMRYYETITKEDQNNRQHGELALQAAHAGVIAAFSWFRAIENQGTLKNQNPIAHGENTPGKYPDKVFLPTNPSSGLDSSVVDAIGNSALVADISPPYLTTATRVDVTCRTDIVTFAELWS